MDEEDEVYLKSYNKQYNEALSEDLFEKIMWECESITSQNWPHLYLDPLQVPLYKDFMDHVPEYSKLRTLPNLAVIYEYWRKRRLASNGKSIIPQLKFEEISKNESDPYVCFRRRETKPVRKTRRSDQQSLERLRKLRSEMEMARNLLEMVLRREKFRKESLVLEHTVFDKKKILHDYQRTLGIKEDDDLLPLSKKKRKSIEGSGATIKIPLHKLKREHYSRPEKSPAQIAIEAELARRKEIDAAYEDVTSCPYNPFPLSIPQQFYQPLSKSTSVQFRKRVGRGGRVFIDRTGLTPFKYRRSFDHYSYLNDLEIDHRYDFDSDEEVDDHSIIQIDEMDSRYLRHRAELLSEAELRSLVTIPFLTPLNIMNMNQARNNIPPMTTTSTPNRSPSTPPSNLSASSATRMPPQPSTALNNALITSTAANNSDMPLKRQNSRTKLTPHQAAVAMANGMLAANMAAVVNNSPNPNKAAMQMAMVAAQQQQQQQQQQLNGAVTPKHNNPPLSLHF